VTWLRVLPPLVALAGCGFELPRAAAGDDGPADANPDAPRDMPGDEGNASVVPCGTPNANGLIACYEMEDGFTDGRLNDSAPARRDAITTGMIAAQRPVPLSVAAQVTPIANTRVSQDPVLDRFAGYTLAMWVHPDSLPTSGTVYGLADHELQYAMLIANNGAVEESRCVHTGVTKFEWTEGLPTSEWSFLACTWDGTFLCAYRWTSTTSHQHFCHRVTTQPQSVGAQGLAIGHLSNEGTPHSRFDGALDSVQLYDHGLGEDELCAIIGQPAGCLPCNTCETVNRE
jgi:hypothetical protein